MEVIKYQFEDGLNLLATEDVKVLFEEIWKDEIYTKEYKIQKGDIVVDVGANVGVFSIYAGKKGAKVYSFEPNPQVFELLRENIRFNHLEDQVVAINAALGDTEDKVDLFIPNSSKVYKEGSASISKQYVGGLIEILYDDFKVYKVQSKTLESFIKEFKLEKVDLLKMDCEGSELCIIKNSNPDVFEIIKNIAMETHCFFYTQKELLNNLIDKKYNIVNYSKPVGRFSNGYLYASNSCSKINPFIVSELRFKDYVRVGERIDFDFSESFHSNIGENLSYKLKIDDYSIELDHTKQAYSQTFEQPGQHDICLEIQGGTAFDLFKKKLWVLKEDYFEDRVNHLMSTMGEKVKIHIHGTQKFCIPSDSFPKTWNFKYIIIGISQEEYNQKNGIECCFNGSRTLTEDLYKEIRLEDIPNKMDVHFSLSTQEESYFSINWWAEGDRELESTGVKTVDEGNKTGCLQQLGDSGLYLFQGRKEFLLHKELLPKHWTPKSIVVGIAAMEYEGIKPFLEGYYLDEFKKIDFKETYYIETRISDFDLLKNIEFQIYNDTKSLIKVAWWAE